MIQFIDVSLAEIILPNDRWREVDDKKVKDIKESFSEYGQLQPIIVRKHEDEDGNEVTELVDGMHRLTAARAVQWPSLEAVVTDEVNPIRLREIELEVNIQRAEVPWQDRELAIAELHKMKSESDPSWTQRRTAEETEKSQTRVAQALKFSEMVKHFPELKDAKSMRQAMSWMNQKAKGVLRVKEVKETTDLSDVDERVVLGDSVDLIKGFPAESVNLVLTDPPFGIGYDNRKAGTEQAVSSYEDSPESYERILTMADDVYRVIAKDGWLVWFLGPSWLYRVSEVFTEAGFLVDPIPVIWDRSDGKCYTTRPDRYFARAYDMALHCIKGSPEMVQRNKPNIIRVPPVEQNERELLVERPVGLYSEIIQRLTVKNETVCDFFVGSGSCLAAAAGLKRRYVGCELHPERRAVAIKKIKAHTP